MPADYHIHTYLCKHAYGEAPEYLEAAERAGLSEIGFADHSPWPEAYDTASRMTPSEYPVYRDIIENLRRKNSNVRIRYGIEADWVPGRMDEVYSNIEDEPLDYIIGSVHYIGDFAFDSSVDLEKWEEPGAADFVWNSYAEELYEFVRTCSFDIIAHPDLPKKFAYYPSSMDVFTERMASVFELASEKGMAIEINTGGLRKKVGRIYPSPELLKLAKEKGMKLTFGSDAHNPEEVGADFKTAVELAKTAGFTHSCLFEARVASEIPL